MGRPHRPLQLLAALALVVVSCSSSNERPLPAGPSLLHRAAASMRDVRTGRFELEVKGELGGLEVRRAEGVMSRAGRASGTVDLEEAGQLVEFDVVFVSGTVYLKGPTGPFQSVPSELAGTIYDPTDLLDPSKGLARLLETAQKPRTLGQGDVNGTDAFRVSATLDGHVLGPLVPNPVPPTVKVTLWIGSDEPHLLPTETTIRAGRSKNTHLSLTIS